MDVRRPQSALPTFNLSPWNQHQHQQQYQHQNQHRHHHFCHSAHRSQPVALYTPLEEESEDALASSDAHSHPSTRSSSSIASKLPLIVWTLTTLIFFALVSFWRPQLFGALDALALSLRQDPVYGRIIMFLLIFITTIPPLPLYSTFIVLAGYTFGLWQGAIIAYLAALSGGVAVFALTRHFFRRSVASWLDSLPALQRVILAVSSCPRLLLLVRIAPYPYNLLNALLATVDERRLSFRTYTLATALSLLKVVVHTSIGAGIRSFAHHHQAHNGETPSEAETTSDRIKEISAVVGVVLCIGLFIYLGFITNRAVDSTLGSRHDRNGFALVGDDEERVAFLADDPASDGPVMVQTLTPRPASAPPAHSSYFDYKPRSQR